MTFRVRVIGDLDSLENDLRALPAKSAKDMQATVRDGAKVGNEVAKDYARATSGTHARKYPGTFSAEQHKPFFGFGVAIFAAEYGPRPSGQGLLAPILENGSRNNKAHRNLARSQDVIGPAFVGEVRKLPDRWFW